MTNDQLRPASDSPTLPSSSPPASQPAPRSAPPSRSPAGRDHLLFLAEALRAFHDTGALAPSGPELVNALVVPVTSRPNRPLSVLEVGAGTGAVTRRLVEVLRPGDRLHVVEANPRFAERLREDPVLAARRPGVEVRLSACRVEELPGCRRPAPEDGGAGANGRGDRVGQGGQGGRGGPDTSGGLGERYDVIVSGLPFTNFEPVQVRAVLDLYLRLLVPGGELTYFGYLGTTAARTLVSGPRRGARHRAVVRLLRGFEAAYGLGARTAWHNLPPARAHLLRAPGGREDWWPEVARPCAGARGAPLG
ncbi:class I SAM-dependent methyltransferase [Streptomyces sp. Y1]|uniref:Class I SAM-dependent methyltransferase n=1 Tax=Streptomyces sp. Y1 TaxID=3238634 RepID=A0AB39TBZ0_9ACTN